MITPTDQHFPGPLAPLRDVVHYSGPGTIEQMKEIRAREGEEAWSEYWKHVEGLLMHHIVDECALLDELRLDVQIMEDFHGEPYVQCYLSANYDTIPPMDKPKTVKWHLN